MDAARKLPKAIILFPVFIPAVIVTLLLVIGTISNPELAGEVFSSTLAFITANFGWFYMLSVAFFLVFIVGIAMTPWGNIKLGPDHAEPQYSFPYCTMLRRPPVRGKPSTRPSRPCRSPSSTGAFISGPSTA